MKTQPLDEILKQITPLPWQYGAIRSALAHQDTSPETDAAYIAHAANVLPELVEASGRALEIILGDLRDSLHGESVTDDDFQAQLRNIRGVAMSLEAVIASALARATSVPVNS